MAFYFFSSFSVLGGLYENMGLKSLIWKKLEFRGFRETSRPQGC